MKRIKIYYFFLMLLLVEFVPWRALAGGEGLDIPEGLDRKVDLTNLSGVAFWFSKLYNENLWLYAIVCTGLMAAVGISIAFVTDLVLKAVGMETEKIEHKE